MKSACAWVLWFLFFLLAPSFFLSFFCVEDPCSLLQYIYIYMRAIQDASCGGCSLPYPYTAHPRGIFYLPSTSLFPCKCTRLMFFPSSPYPGADQAHHRAHIFQGTNPPIYSKDRSRCCGRERTQVIYDTVVKEGNVVCWPYFCS